MKIGLLSVQNHNYGSILQAYAMQTVLQQMGNETEIIRYKKTNILKQATRLLYYPLLKATVKAKWKNIYSRVFQKNTYETVLASREKVFAEFVSTNFVFSEVYVGREALCNGTDNYDAFVLGSDQVWNPMNLGGDFFTMTFIPDDKLKVTYAPSFGVSTIPNSQMKKTRDYLKRIDYISVREATGVKLVKELTGRDVTQVVDPTILLDRTVWDEKKGNRLEKDNYILCYYISAYEEYRDFAIKLAEKTGLKIVTIPHVDEYVQADENFGDIVPEGIGPLQFINLISNAAYVCTDSFHGSVFSTLYERPFFVFSRYNKDGGDSTNSRLYSFLELLDMKDRMISASAEISDDMLKAIDFTVAKQRLEESRNISIEYLRNALKV